jgi:hypothetical protein
MMRNLLEDKGDTPVIFLGASQRKTDRSLFSFTFRPESKLAIKKRRFWR